MKPSEVRRQILDDHEKLRAMLARLEDTAQHVLSGEGQLLGRTSDPLKRDQALVL